MREITIAWGEATSCTGCGCQLPAGAPAWTEGDAILCCDCAAAEAAA